MRAACLFPITVLGVLTSGCGSGLTLVPVSGTVKVDGAPLADASVQFLPSTPNPNGETSTGVTGPDGRYEVKTEGHAGVVPGKYRVMVSWKAPLDPSLIPEEFKDDPFMAEQLIPPERKGKRKQPNGGPALPEKINETFVHEVPAEGKTIDLEVSKSEAKKATTKTAPKRRPDK